MDNLNKYQIHCPKCKYEFVWNLDPLERRQQRIINRMTEVNGLIADMKSFNDPERLNFSAQYRRLKSEYNQLLMENTQIKEIKKANAKITGEIYAKEFKAVIREKYGEEEYNRLVEETQNRLKPATIEHLMQEGKYL